jgi:argininosuccinate lyase
MMKGLPSGYNRDFHEDKEILIEGLTLVNRALEIVPALVQTTTLHLDRMADLTYKNFATATEGTIETLTVTEICSRQLSRGQT